MVVGGETVLVMALVRATVRGGGGGANWGGGGGVKGAGVVRVLSGGAVTATEVDREIIRDTESTPPRAERDIPLSVRWADI